ncbi:ParM/StbA family protein [Clostridium botulinum]|uniref:ParM/StbA family protein n=1 Tax=Clostridium botulinum TaxID=1491 RepID=A0A846J7X3_CLOBO|nr:ParM/StbA family protein [Clostridium botulinum]ACA57322.1 hypothetical protein CLK_A0227 [Clostridium botulinum A3 str. Loch Maree]NFJ09592.1 ParM/StbA family protein [Clostridium botulinum]NFK16561.1 ParM/StbA family protein [Clostridium botulinum]NFM95822.1 ParM/StbA family protein [Clostridium botulinum]
MKNIIAGVDTGFGYGIGMTNDTEVKMKNYINNITEKEALNIADTIKELNDENTLIKYNGKYFICGDACIERYPDTMQRLNRDRIKDEYHLIELLSIVGQLTKESEFNLYLCVGLPNRSKGDSKKFEDWLKGSSFEFSYLCNFGEVKKKVYIKDVTCLPQAYSPIFTLPRNDMNKTIFSVDIGHSTLDLMLVKNMQTVMASDTLLDGEGCIRIYNNLKQALIRQNEDKKITYYSYSQLQEILENGNYSLYGEEQQIENILNRCLEEYAEYVFFTIENNMYKYMPTVDTFIFSGGLLNNTTFKTILSDKFKQAYKIPLLVQNNRSQYTIAEGLKEYSNIKYADKLEVVKENDIKAAK